MKICDRCHGSKNVKGPYTTGVHLDDVILHPCFQIINIDLCDRCLLTIRELIREFLKPIGYIEVKPNVKNSVGKTPPESSPIDSFTETFGPIPGGLV